MKTNLLLIYCFIFFSSASHAQSFIKYWDKTYGGDKLESAGQILYSGNNELYLSGMSKTNVNGDKTAPLCNPSQFGQQDVWLLKIDTSLNIIWQDDLGGENGELLPGLKLAASYDKLIFSCQSISDSACDKTEHTRGDADYWIYLCDTSGNKIWDKTFGGNSADYQPVICQLSSGDFIVSGKSVSDVSGDKTAANYGGWDVWAVKFDSMGNKLWDNVYGGIGEENSHTINTLDSVNFILGGETMGPVSGDVSDTSRGLQDWWIIKIDSAGNKIWDKRFGGSASEHCNFINSTPDNGFILCGFTNSPQDGDVSDPPRGDNDYWVIKIDSMGNKQWDRRFGGSLTDEATWVMPSLDGGYLVGGYSNSDSSFDVSENSFGDTDYWILKLDSAGNKIWDKRYGGPGNDFLTNFIIMPDSSIILFGYADSGVSAVKIDAGKGDFDYWLIRFKSSDTNVGLNENTYQNNSISISPNPTQGKFILNTASKEKGDVFIYDAIGKEIYLKQSIFLNHFEIDISSFTKGVYFLKVKSGEVYFLKKVVKM